MRITANFTLEEMCFSETALRLGIKNLPNEKQTKNLILLVKGILQPVRDHFGILRIPSGFRNPELNKAVGGAVNSQHMDGLAADMYCPGVGNDELWNYIKSRVELPWDQLILEHVPRENPELGWVHVSTANTLRRQALSCPTKGYYPEGLHYAQ